MYFFLFLKVCNSLFLCLPQAVRHSLILVQLGVTATTVCPPCCDKAECHRIYNIPVPPPLTSYVRSFIHSSFVCHSFILSFIHSFIHSFVHSFVHCPACCRLFKYSRTSELRTPRETRVFISLKCP